MAEVLLTLAGLLLILGALGWAEQRKRKWTDDELATMFPGDPVFDPAIRLPAPLESSTAGAGTVGDCVPEALRRNEKRAADIRQFAQRRSVR